MNPSSFDFCKYTTLKVLFAGFVLFALSLGLGLAQGVAPINSGPSPRDLPFALPVDFWRIPGLAGWPALSSIRLIWTGMGSKSVWFLIGWTKA